MSSSLPMPCAIRNLPSCQISVNQPALQVKIEINGDKEEKRRTFTTGDLIEGNAILSVTRETDLGHVDITFEGSSTTSASRAVSFVPGRRKASHNFLRLRQPIDELQETHLVPGQSYSFPFSFIVPESISPQHCEHSIKDAEVEQAHTQLPPTFESQTAKFWQSTRGGWAPKACKISYKIRVAISDKSQATSRPRSKLCDVCRSLRIMPTTAPAKCPDYPTQYLVYERQSECRSMGRTLGHLQVAAEEPRPVRISSTNIGVNNVSTSAIQLHLTFESTTNAPPPQLCKLRSKLEVATYYGTSPWEDYPKAEDMESSNTDREACVTTTPLRSLDLTSTQWEKLPTFYSATKDLTDCASVSSSRTSSQPSWHVSVTVPVDLPEEQALVPTFHSCLVSRTYTVDLALSYDVPSSICKSSMNLRIPLEVVFGSRK